MEYCFILGKNHALSISEIIHYLKNREINFKLLEFKKDYAIISIENIAITHLINDLGGTIKIGKYISKDFQFRDVFNKYEEKVRIGLSVYPNNRKFYEELKQNIKTQFKEYKVKYKIVSSGYTNTTSLKHFEVTKKLLKNNGKEIIVIRSENSQKIFLTISVHNPFEFKKRDVERPKQRPIFSIPPRLAKILINLAAKPGDVLLDPFCGIGTILQEALIMGIKPIGIDKDNKCVQWSKENIEWIRKIYSITSNADIFEGDATKLSEYFENESIDCIVTEPYLGPPLKFKPTKKEAEEIIKNLEKMYAEFLCQSYNILKRNAKVSIVFPNFLTKDGFEVKVDIEKLCQLSGFSRANLLENKKTIIDADKDQITRREIVLLKK
ncbi:MAG: DNA methyltransferase [Candidatus Aenigmarchaeota archaeon]|nr:DNA methyltransferase [Candidatus Aenigmarchaeota archaeon]